MYNIWYTHPIQVKYFNPDETLFRSGIVYHSDLICCHCGQHYNVNDILAKAEVFNISEDEAVIELSWKNLDNAIL